MKKLTSRRVAAIIDYCYEKSFIDDELLDLIEGLTDLLRRED